MNTEQSVQQVIRGAGMIPPAQLSMSMIANLVSRLGKTVPQEGVGFLMMHEDTLQVVMQLVEAKHLFEIEYRQSRNEDGYQGYLYGMVVFTHDAIDRDTIYAAQIAMKGHVIASMGIKLISG